jgi:hypothetical protein
MKKVILTLIFILFLASFVVNYNINIRYVY